MTCSLANPGEDERYMTLRSGTRRTIWMMLTLHSAVQHRIVASGTRLCVE
jgi:hypothetical protein